MELIVTKVPNQQSGLDKIQINDSLFGSKFNEGLVHQVVVAHAAAARSGTKAQKSRSEVRGGGIKPWKQKGTGRARAGTIRSPLWRKGGVTFAAKPRDYAQKVNKKMYRGAMQSIFAELLRQDRLIVVEDFIAPSKKTKDLKQKLQEMNLRDVFIITDKVEENLYLASRNLYEILVSDITGVDPLSLIGFSKIMITVPALKQIEAILV